jgi:hypothetical protein
MPLFDSASGLQITGGTFIDNAGDININTTQLQMASQNRYSDPLQALEFFAAQGLSRELSGVERNGQQVGAARKLPYGMFASCVISRPLTMSSKMFLIGHKF